MDFLTDAKWFEMAVALACVLFFAFVGVATFVLWPAWKRTVERLKRMPH